MRIIFLKFYFYNFYKIYFFLKFVFLYIDVYMISKNVINEISELIFNNSELKPIVFFNKKDVSKILDILSLRFDIVNLEFRKTFFLTEKLAIEYKKEKDVTKKENLLNQYNQINDNYLELKELCNKYINCINSLKNHQKIYLGGI